MEEQNEQDSLTKQPKKWFTFLGNIFDANLIQKQFSYILYLVFFLMFYIFNGHNAVRLTRTITQLSKQVDTLRYTYLIYKSELTDMTHQSSLAEFLKKTGLKPLRTQPYLLQDTLLIEKNDK